MKTHLFTVSSFASTSLFFLFFSFCIFFFYATKKNLKSKRLCTKTGIPTNPPNNLNTSLFCKTASSLFWNYLKLFTKCQCFEMDCYWRYRDIITRTNYCNFKVEFSWNFVEKLWISRITELRLLFWPDLTTQLKC